MRDPDVLAQLAREHLTAALLSDALDECGLIHQIMDCGIRLVDESLVLCGRARTGRLDTVDYADAKPDVHEALVEMVASLDSGEVLVLACGQNQQIQAWGDLLSLDAQQRGVAGCVTDGLVRDVARVRALGFPACCVSRSAVDTRGRLVATDVPMQCGGVWVSPGDLVFADVDGVIIVPQEAEADVIRIALGQATLEQAFLRALREGVSMTEAYHRYGTF